MPPSCQRTINATLPVTLWSETKNDMFKLWELIEDFDKPPTHEACCTEVRANVSPHAQFRHRIDTKFGQEVNQTRNHEQCRLLRHLRAMCVAGGPCHPPHNETNHCHTKHTSGIEPLSTLFRTARKLVMLFEVHMYIDAPSFRCVHALPV